MEAQHVPATEHLATDAAPMEWRSAQTRGVIAGAIAAAVPVAMLAYSVISGVFGG